MCLHIISVLCLCVCLKFQGHDTTSVGISWAMYLLGSHPEIQVSFICYIFNWKIKFVFKAYYVIFRRSYVGTIQTTLSLCTRDSSVKQGSHDSDY